MLKVNRFSLRDILLVLLQLRGTKIQPDSYRVIDPRMHMFHSEFHPNDDRLKVVPLSTPTIHPHQDSLHQ
jgi:hypothetical protein